MNEKGYQGTGSVAGIAVRELRNFNFSGYIECRKDRCGRQAMVAACAFLMLCRVIYSQDIRLKGDKTATQPSAEASPPAKLGDNEQSSHLLDRRPIDGSIVGRKYTNKFFDFSIEFPENWIVLSVSQGPREAKGSCLCSSGGGKPRQANAWESVDSHRGTRPHNSSLSAPSVQSLMEKGANDIDLVTSMGLGKGFRPIEKPSEVRIGGRRMTRLHLAAEVNLRGSDYETRWSQLALVERGCMLMIISSDPINRESDAESAMRARDSLRFFGEVRASGR